MVWFVKAVIKYKTGVGLGKRYPRLRLPRKQDSAYMALSIIRVTSIIAYKNWLLGINC